MTADFFEKQMQRIFETFGAANYPKPKVERIWRIVRDLEEKQFQELCDNLIGDIPVKYPPQGTHFREHAYQIRQKYFHKESSRAYKNIVYNSTNEGLKKFLNKVGASSALDAMKKVKNKSQV